MSVLSPNLIFPFFIFTAGGTAAGWAITTKLGGSEAGYSFLYLGIVVVPSICVLQIVFCLLGKHRVVHQLHFGIAVALSLVWFMLCLVLPLLWIGTISSAIKLLILFFLISLSVSNFIAAFQQFNQKWMITGESSFAKHYNKGASTIDWQSVIRPLKLNAELYLPGLPQWAAPILSVLLVVSMLVGLNIRKAFPVFSTFAWGIPLCFIISIFVQMIGLCFAQIVKITSLEKKNGKKIRPKMVSR